MKKRNLVYWVPTVIAAFAFAAGGISGIAGAPEMAASFEHLGYPPYLGKVLGVWKVLGAAAVLAPGVPRLKEWAYAGMFFNLTGAALSHAFVGDAASEVLVPLVVLAFVLTSWALRPEGRTLEAKAPHRARSQGRGSRSRRSR